MHNCKVQYCEYILDSLMIWTCLSNSVLKILTRNKWHLIKCNLFWWSNTKILKLFCHACIWADQHYGLRLIISLKTCQSFEFFAADLSLQSLHHVCCMFHQFLWGKGLLAWHRHRVDTPVIYGVQCLKSSAFSVFIPLPLSLSFLVHNKQSVLKGFEKG